MYTGGAREIELSARTVREVFEGLRAEFEDLAHRILDHEGRPDRVRLFVGKCDAHRLDGLDTELGEDDKLAIVPLVSGGGLSH